MEQLIDTRNLYLDLDVEHLNFIFFWQPTRVVAQKIEEFKGKQILCIEKKGQLYKQLERNKGPLD